MFFRTTITLIVLSAVATVTNAQSCPLPDPPEAGVDTCSTDNQMCRYGFRADLGCQPGYVWQCMCAKGGDPWICECRGDPFATEAPVPTTLPAETVPIEESLQSGTTTDAESLDISGAASLNVLASSVAILGAVALF